MDQIDGFKLFSRYCLAEAEHGLSGPHDADIVLKRFLENPSNDIANQVKNLIRRFDSVYLYLKTIGEANGLEPFDPAVIEAYWVGNALLDNVNRNHIHGVVRELKLPAHLTRSLLQRVSRKLTLHHLFDVMYIGVGRVNGNVKCDVMSMDKCRVSWGEVIDIEDGKVTLSYRPLLRSKKGLYYLGTEILKIVDKNELCVDTGDLVSFHWDTICEVLSDERLELLQKYTLQMIDAVNL